MPPKPKHPESFEGWHRRVQLDWPCGSAGSFGSRRQIPDLQQEHHLKLAKRTTKVKMS